MTKSFDDYLKEYPNGLPSGFQIKQFFGAEVTDTTPPDDGGDPPPTTARFSVYTVSEHDANPNGRVIVYKTPDVNDTNKDAVYVRSDQTLRIVNSINDPEIQNLVYFKDLDEAHRLNTWKEWAVVKQSVIINANGKFVPFPEIFLAGGTTRAAFCWVHRADLGAKLREEN